MRTFAVPFGGAAHDRTYCTTFGFRTHAMRNEKGIRCES